MACDCHKINKNAIKVLEMHLLIYWLNKWASYFSHTFVSNVQNSLVFLLGELNLTIYAVL